MPVVIKDQEQSEMPQTEAKKLYLKPEFVHELDLEIRAGSTIIPLIDDPLDSFNP